MDIKSLERHILTVQSIQFCAARETECAVQDAKLQFKMIMVG